jgi:hypothetical protein
VGCAAFFVVGENIKEERGIPHFADSVRDDVCIGTRGLRAQQCCAPTFWRIATCAREWWRQLGEIELLLRRRLLLCWRGSGWCLRGDERILRLGW